jgi:hypothetical protein
MVQMPRDVDALAVDSFVVGALTVGAGRDTAVVAARRAVVSPRVGCPVFRVALAVVELAVGPLLDARGEEDEPPVGEPDDRTVGAAVPGAGVAVVAALAVAAGQRVPW